MFLSGLIEAQTVYKHYLQTTLTCKGLILQNSFLSHAFYDNKKGGGEEIKN